jgi:uncharacterized membrane protein YbhN (UPF0104 family)
MRAAGGDRPARLSPRRGAAWSLLAVPALGLLLWLDPLGEVLGEFGGLDLRWLTVAAGLELASCVGYVVVFRRLFDRIAARPAGKLAWLGLGAGALLPGGNVAGVAASCLSLHRDGVPSRPLVVRSSVLLLLVNAVCVAVTAVAGVLLLSGAAAGPHDLLAAGLPILVAAAIAGVVAAIPFAVRRSAGRAPAWIMPLADAVGDAGRLLRRPDWRLLGAAAYPLLDMGALWAACAATGHPPSLAELVVAYNVGYLASILPVPAGIGVLDGGLAAALILYGAPSSVAVTAALAYHALAVWIPVIGGLVASIPLRREHLRRRAPAVVPARVSGLPVRQLGSERV